MCAAAIHETELSLYALLLLAYHFVVCYQFLLVAHRDKAYTYVFVSIVQVLLFD